MDVPAELRYTEEHEWVDARSEAVRVGITEYAQDQLGDVVFVDLPEPGTSLTAGDVFGEVESTKSVSELFAPIDGEIIVSNAAVADAPELINSDPYGEGWLVEIMPAEPADVGALLDADAYQKLIEG
ncbi:MAG: glycine cleavage system protein GcvH [Actinophytocola sp.]|nr:glycine cleavage system protein GcvH [Actinophytocola sp.]